MQVKCEDDCGKFSSFAIQRAHIHCLMSSHFSLGGHEFVCFFFGAFFRTFYSVEVKNSMSFKFHEFHPTFQKLTAV